MSTPTKLTFYCPYLGREVTDEKTLEHIFSDALGCPNSYGVSVSKTANGLVNRGFEQKFLLSSNITRLRQKYHLKGRRGIPDRSVQGTILDGQVKAGAVIKPNGEQENRFYGATLPETDTTGTILYDPSRPEDMERQRKKIEAEHSGNEVVLEKTEESIINEPIVEDQPFSDAEIIQRFVAKVAFAGLLRQFPEYGQDPVASLWREMLFGANQQGASGAIMAHPTPIWTDASYFNSIFPGLMEQEHAWAAYVRPGASALDVTVVLFGGLYSGAYVASTTNKFGIELGAGVSVRCDIGTGQIHEDTLGPG